MERREGRGGGRAALGELPEPRQPHGLGVDLQRRLGPGARGGRCGGGEQLAVGGQTGGGGELQALRAERAQVGALAGARVAQDDRRRELPDRDGGSPRAAPRHQSDGLAQQGVVDARGLQRHQRAGVALQRAPNQARQRHRGALHRENYGEN